MIIEWNAHVFSGATLRYLFHPQAAYIPAEPQQKNRYSYYSRSSTSCSSAAIAC